MGVGARRTHAAWYFGNTRISSYVTRSRCASIGRVRAQAATKQLCRQQRSETSSFAKRNWTGSVEGRKTAIGNALASAADEALREAQT